MSQKRGFQLCQDFGQGRGGFTHGFQMKSLDLLFSIMYKFSKLLPTLLFNNFWKFQAHSFNFSAREREDAQEWIIRSQKVFDFSIFQFTFQLPFLLAPDFYQLQLIEDCVWPASKTISVMQQIQLFSHFFFTTIKKN